MGDLFYILQGVNLIRVIPSTAVTFVTYEKLNCYLLDGTGDASST